MSAKKILQLWFSLSILLSLTSVTWGQTASTGTMRDECRAFIRMQDKEPVSAEDAQLAYHCLGFVQGFSNAMVLFSPNEFKAGVTTDQLIRVFVQWADQN